MDYEEPHNEQDEEIGIQVPTANYESVVGRGKMGISPGGGVVVVGEGSSALNRKSSFRFRECLKNHAVNIGGHAVDGCGEFLAAGDEGTLDGLKCAACNCHRNFHRKEPGAEGEGLHHNHQPPHQQQYSGYYRSTPQVGYHLQMAHPPAAAIGAHHRPLALPSTSFDDQEDDMSNPNSGGGGSGGGSKKRFRTKFTGEQKEKMLELAVRLDWRIQKQDEGLVEQFCADSGVSRQVLKVWMHNNKHTLGKKP